MWVEVYGLGQEMGVGKWRWVGGKRGDGWVGGEGGDGWVRNVEMGGWKGGDGWVEKVGGFE